MCDPVTAAGLALSAGGTFLQQREAQKNEQRMTDARNAAFVEDMNKQRRFADETGAAFNQNIQNQGKQSFDQRKEIEAARIEQAFNDRRVQPDYNVGLTSNAPKNVVLARQSASDKANNELDRDITNNAALQSYGGAMFNQGLDRSEFGRLFGNIQDKASAQSRLLPLNMNAAANNARKAPSLFPSLMKLGGAGLSTFGAGGGSFSNTVQGSVPAGTYGPGAPMTSYGLFMDNKPVNLFGYDLAGRYS